MKKIQRQREHIAYLKESFRHLSTDTIARRLTNFSRSNDISIAYKELLKSVILTIIYREALSPTKTNECKGLTHFNPATLLKSLKFLVYISRL